ncbi:MAG: hypothetical protein QM662_00120 [Gordonia sp. (in: high G+C Gram-positive bacteria)]
MSEPFASDSPWRRKLDPSAATASNSTAMIRRAARRNAMNANLSEFGIPIYQATTSTPRYSVRCRVTEWGECPFAGHRVPIPEGATPQAGSDGAMVVIDQQAGEIYEFWQARHVNGQWSASWGAVNDLHGSGWGGASTGAGASRLAGVIRVSEIEQGRIPHALAIQTDNVCAGIFNSPAIKTDGTSKRSDCIPEGARVRLDPNLNLRSLRLTAAERTVAEALQVYGAYVIDRGGTPLSVSFEREESSSGGGIGRVYTDFGLRWDYDDLGGIPFRRLQVLG